MNDKHNIYTNKSANPIDSPLYWEAWNEMCDIGYLVLFDWKNMIDISDKVLKNMFKSIAGLLS